MKKDSAAQADDFPQDGGGGFEPPKYVTSLIAAVNDGAKAAQAGMLFYLLVGFYLLATAFSSTDEDLLLGKAVTIAQIGASLPVSFSFAIAPFVFVFLHVYSLTRFDMLAINLRFLRDELRATVPLEMDRERCRQLLANVEFVAALAMPRQSKLRSGKWLWMIWALLGLFPLAILLFVQINALRYQSETILWTQRAWMFGDLVAVQWFFRRNRLFWPGSWLYRRVRVARRLRRIVRRAASLRKWLSGRWHRTGKPARMAGWLGRIIPPRLTLLPAIASLLIFAYVHNASSDADAYWVRYEGSALTIALLTRPLDTMFCPHLSWGCRYLRVERRPLVGRVWDDKRMVDLRADGEDRAKALAAVEGVELIGRSLRFAVLTESRLYAADMADIDLSKALLDRTDLSGARLFEAQLAGANLRGVQLAGANLSKAQLAGADLVQAQLAGADLSQAQLAGAILVLAQLTGAILSQAQLAGADLSQAQLAGANLSWAQLAGANLYGAQLAGADLSRAQLAGADLSEAQLAGADVRNAHAGGFVPKGPMNLWLADLRGIDLDTPLSSEKLDQIGKLLDSLPKGFWRDAASERLEPVLSGKLDCHAFEVLPNSVPPILVSGPIIKPPTTPDRLSVTGPDHGGYRPKLAEFLVATAAKLPQSPGVISAPDAGGRDVRAVARQIASRAVGYMFEQADDSATDERKMEVAEDPETGLEIACKLLTAADAKPPRVQLEQRSRDDLVAAMARLKLPDHDANGCPKPTGGG